MKKLVVIILLVVVGILAIVYRHPIREFILSYSGPTMGEVSSYLGGNVNVGFYRNPEIKIEERGVVLTSSNGAGLMVRLAVDSPRRIILRGKNITGVATLRVKFGNGNAVYENMTDGWVSLNVCHATDIELLIYSEQSYTYRIGSLTTEEIPESQCNEPRSDVPHIENIRLADQIEEVLGKVATAEPYLKPDVEVDTNNVTWNSSDKAGMFFKFSFEPGAQKSINFKGKNISEIATLRTRYDNGEPVYEKMSGGWVVVTACGATDVELLVYSEAPSYTYRLESITTEDAAPDECEGKLADVPSVKHISLGEQAELRLGGDVHVESYHAPEIKLEGSGVTISSTTPAGLFFRFSFDPSVRKRIVLKGKNMTGSATLRTIFDQGSPDYQRLGSGSSSVNVCGSKDVELLIYSDSDYEYHLESLTTKELSDDECGNQ